MKIIEFVPFVHFSFILWCILELNLEICTGQGVDKTPLRLAVLAPGDETLPFALHKIVPAVIYAVQTLSKQGGRQIEVLHRDTECSSTYGPLHAFELYNSGLADVLLGPLCPYVLAPVARYSSVWDLPILTAAGQNDNFDIKEPHYRLMTRMNGSYSQIGLIFLQVLKKFNWKVVALLFHNFDDRTLGNSDCYFTLGAVYTALGRKSFYKDFDETLPTVNYVDMLKEVSQNARDYQVFDPRVTSKVSFANQSNYTRNVALENREFKTFIHQDTEDFDSGKILPRNHH